MRRCPEREDHVKTESFSDISTSQGMPKTSAKLPKDKENQTLLYRFQRAHDPATNFILDFQSPEWQYSGLLLPQHIQFVTLCYSSLLDLILGGNNDRLCYISLLFSCLHYKVFSCKAKSIVRSRLFNLWLKAKVSFAYISLSSVSLPHP